MLLRSAVGLLTQNTNRAAYVRLISCSSLTQAGQSRQTSKTSPKLLPPEERAKHLRSAEKRVAVVAGVSLVIGYFALKRMFSDMSSKRPPTKSDQPVPASSSSPSLPRPLVVAGPSGSGKSTLLRKLFQQYPDRFGFSVSHTTRSPRDGEVNGREYHFTNRVSMKKEIDAGEFIEWAEYSGNLYGTSKKAVRDVQLNGKVCVLDIDMQGVRSLKKTDLEPFYVLVKPPSMKTLEERLRARQTETEDSLQKRLTVAKEELTYGDQPGVFDHVVVNSTVDEAYKDLHDFVEQSVGTKSSS